MSPPAVVSVELLPTELVFRILSDLPLEDLKNFSLCSRPCRTKSLPILFDHIKSNLNRTELITVFFAFKDEGPLAHIRSNIKRTTLYASTSSINDIIGGYRVFTESAHLFNSLAKIHLGINVPTNFLEYYPDFCQRLFHMIFRRLGEGGPAYYTLKQVSLVIRVLGCGIGLRPSESTRGYLNKESRDFLELPSANVDGISLPAPLVGNYFPPNLEELYFDYAPYQTSLGPLYPLSSVLTARETLKSVYLNIVQLNGNRRMEDYGFPDGEFPNVKTLRVHPHFLYDGAKLFKPLVKLFPNVENLAIYIAHQMFVGNRLVYVEHYDSISLFQKVKDIRTFWPEDYDYEHGSEFLSPWRLEGIVKGWAKNARVLEKVVFVRSTPKWRCGGTDTMEAIRVRVEWVGGECETKCLWSERYKAERLEFDVD